MSTEPKTTAETIIDDLLLELCRDCRNTTSTDTAVKQIDALIDKVRAEERAKVIEECARIAETVTLFIAAEIRERVASAPVVAAESESQES